MNAEAENKHPVSFNRARVDLCVRLQMLLMFFAILLVPVGTIWILLDTSALGWYLLYGAAAFTLAQTLFAVVWRHANERKWWGVRRGWPEYLKNL